MNTRLKCLLLDDELPGLTYLKRLCEQIPELEIVKAFNSPETMLAEIPRLAFDLCILDIEMPGLNGLEVAQLLNGKPVIFTTAYKEYASDAFDIDAIDYVQKPVKLERLRHAIQKARNQLSVRDRANPFLKVNTDKGNALIPFDHLLYFRTSDADSRDKVVQLSDGTSRTLKNISFGKLQEMLPSDDFVRINKKEIIAVKVVRYFSFNEITTTIIKQPGVSLKLALSEVYKNDFLRKTKS